MNGTDSIARCREPPRETRNPWHSGCQRWGSLRFPEEFSGRGDKRLAEYHWKNRQFSQQRVCIVQSLCTTPKITGVEALVIVGRLSVAIEPIHKTENCCLHLLDFRHFDFCCDCDSPCRLC